jgi:Dehydrogenases (flavoproteins)
MERESMDYDVVIIGGGPSGFGTAIKLAQIFKETNQEKTICVLEKSAEIGGHIFL